MMRLGYFAAAAAIALAGPAAAQSVFDGTWKIDVSSAQLPTKPYVISLASGTYRCASCVPAWSAKADGAFHPVSGQPYFDAVSVTMVDPRTVRFTYRNKGRIIDTVERSVSADGRTMTYHEEDRSTPNGVLHYDGTMTRLGKGAAGAHALSGSWRTDKGAKVSDAALTATIRTHGNAITFSQPTGIAYTATFGGPAVAITGDPARTMAALRKTGPRTITETDTRDGKVVGVTTLTAAPDGKTMTIASTDKVQGTTTRYTAHKQ